MVLGEAQILGQLKDAYRVAQDAGSTGPALNKLFQAAFSAAKRVRTETRIGANAVSLASAAVSVARRVYSDLSEHTALLVGAGEMIALTARHLAAQGVKRMVIANRSLGRAQALAAELKAYAVGLNDLAGIGGRRHRDLLYREPGADHHQDDGGGGRARAAPSAHFHGRPGGAARHRAAGRRARGRIYLFRSTTCRSSSMRTASSANWPPTAPGS
jgi:hypothetical protein